MKERAVQGLRPARVVIIPSNAATTKSRAEKRRWHQQLNADLKLMIYNEYIQQLQYASNDSP